MLTHATLLRRIGDLSLSSAAEAYAAVGVPVFPCIPGGKRPLTRHGFHDATTSQARVHAWWQRWPEANIGLATGSRSGFDVVDVDVHPSGSGFRAFRSACRAGLADGWACLVRTPSGGLHAYYPGTATQRCWSLASAHIDFRGIGGYVIAPPSTVTNDDGSHRSYLVVAIRHRAQPVDGEAVWALLAPPMPTHDSTSTPPQADASIERIAAWVAVQPKGNRNSALYWAAHRYAEHGVTEASAHRSLGAAAQRSGLDATEAHVTIRSAYRRHFHSPPQAVHQHEISPPVLMP
ncbi:DNA replication protein [Actinobacteria bacterium YIM 96077]|uniref:DNA replication protein n=1 Tax=Phytoactinopolyspora halophila TaxID=1981511 RepID=A0A329QPI4_9ACTN|nr:bifunctional DNA primase/polymerase [Phytoactinopolyspora halophila]AYY12998.1 DNA replication protein [Actinobacteria bacterium YIM 96077]RAW13262.1 DNA replication protein [Phytoactinopolyspora halophila]